MKEEEKLYRERLRDDLSERSLSHGSGRGANVISAKNEAFFHVKITQRKEPLANACLNWLLVLYYEGSSLKGWGGCPFGIETNAPNPSNTKLIKSKRLGMPVRD